MDLNQLKEYLNNLANNLEKENWRNGHY